MRGKKHEKLISNIKAPEQAKRFKHKRGALDEKPTSGFFLEIMEKKSFNWTESSTEADEPAEGASVQTQTELKF